MVSLVLLFFGSVAAPVAADVRLPRVLGDHMVLQRQMPLPVWGWAAPDEAVAVQLGSNKIETKADAKGTWMVRLPAMQAGGPHELTVSGKNTIKLTDILVGEVWLCSGQSNMEMGLGVVENGEKEVAEANHPRIRLLALPYVSAGEPNNDVDATWSVCTPETVSAGRWGGFTAVGYFFGRELHRELDVPIGLIDSSWGGTRIEPWTPLCGFRGVPILKNMVEDIERRDFEYKREILPKKMTEIEKWMQVTRRALATGEKLPASPGWPRHPLQSEGEPTGLYNAMIHPLAPFAIRGAIWYQGESHVGTDDGRKYHDLMKALVGGWREVWGEGDFPFYYVQLAPFNYTLFGSEFKSDQMPRIWQAQLASLDIPNTGMAVTTDIGNANDIHPYDKLTVGKRLSLWAMAKTYGREDLVYSGPLYQSMAVEGAKARVNFDHVGGGLASRDKKPLNWFEVAGEDNRFVAAQAEIEGKTVLVWSEAVNKPAAVRFSWHMTPEPIPNLINQEGLPASPFTTNP